MNAIIIAIKDGGPVIIATALLLLAMSISSFAIIFAETARIMAALKTIPRDPSLAPAGQWELLSTSPLHVRQQRAREAADAGQGAMTFLASIASNAPYIGLFGTVVSIYAALTRLGAGTPVSLQEISAPVGEALVMTAIGLSVAVPAVLGYNLLLRLRSHHANLIFAYCELLAGTARPSDMRLLSRPYPFIQKA